MDRAGLARFLHRQRAEMRKWFSEGDFIEVSTPVLFPMSEPFPAGEFTYYPPGASTPAGVLNSGSAVFLTGLLPHLGKVWSISPAFRGGAEPDNSLEEFRFVELRGPGSLETAMGLAEDFIRHMTKELSEDASQVSPSKEPIPAVPSPIPHITYRDVLRRRGGERSELRGLSHEDELAVSDWHGSRLVVVTDLPTDVRPAWVDVRVRDDTYTAFELVGPFAGGIIEGGELEPETESVVSRFAEAARRSSGTEMNSDTARDRVAAHGELSEPQFFLAFGFERLTQFLLRLPKIEDAVLFPVSPQAETPDAAAASLMVR